MKRSSTIWNVPVVCVLLASQTHAADVIVAQRTVIQNLQLSNADAKVRAMVTRLNLTYLEIASSPQASIFSSLTDRDPNLSIPAPIPAHFTPPPLPLPQKP